MKILTALVALAMLALTGCAKEFSATDNRPNVATLQLRFQNRCDSVPLQLGTTYQNSFGEPFTVSKLKYYISNVALFSGAEGAPFADTYFLVDEAVPASKNISIPITPGLYQQFSLLLGVDSARNVSGSQAGALDPANEMFWSPRQGYIMTLLEGSSPRSGSAGNKLQYHIGGFAGDYSALRTVDAGFFAPVYVGKGQTLTITLTADVLRWFDGVHELPIGRHAAALEPGPLASQYADNGSYMLSISDMTLQ